MIINNSDKYISNNIIVGGKMVNNIDLKKAIAPYKIVDHSDFSLKLKRRYDLKTLIILVVIVFIVWTQLMTAPKVVHICLFILILIFFSLYRWSKSHQPMNINMQHGIISLRYNKFFGGNNEVIIESRNIKCIRSDIIQSRRGTYAVISLCFSNDKCEALYFAHRQYNKRLVIEFSRLIAKTFVSIIGVPLLQESESSEK